MKRAFNRVQLNDWRKYGYINAKIRNVYYIWAIRTHRIPQRLDFNFNNASCVLEITDNTWLIIRITIWCRSSQDESRLARVKRVLAGSLLGRGAGTSRIFGTRLELVEPYLDTGVPYVVHRLCSYIEANGFQSAAVFRLSGGSPRLAERLRAAFERRGDADLEAAGCPPTAATLLRQYLKELPQPVVPSAVVGRLLSVHARKNSIQISILKCLR